MFKLLLFDINYTNGVNRSPLIIKIKHWQKANIKITIFTNLEGVNYYNLKFKDVSFITVPFRYNIKSPYSLLLEYIRVTIIALPRFLKTKGQFDILYSLATLDFLFLPWVLRNIDRKIRWFAMVDNVVPQPGKRPGNFTLNTISYIAFLIGNLLLKRTDGIFVVTDLLKKYYEKKGVKVIKTGNGYGVDHKIFRGEVHSNTPIFNALYCGRIHIAKGVFDLVEVFKNVVLKDKKFTLGIMGDGDENTKARLIGKIKEYHLENNIFLIGYKEGYEKGNIYQSCGVFIFLSYDENCPQTVLEAFAANKQVIAYNLPVYHDVFKKYINTGELALFNKGDVKAISDYIVKGKFKESIYLNDPADFSWEKITKKEIKAFYKSNIRE